MFYTGFGPGITSIVPLLLKWATQDSSTNVSEYKRAYEHANESNLIVATRVRKERGAADFLREDAVAATVDSRYLKI